MNKLKNLWPYLIIIIFVYLIVRQFFIPGFFPIHDDTQVARVFEMHKSLLDGMLPVRWVADLGYGYGYPIFNFYAPLAYYVGALLMFTGFDALLATKMMMALGIVLAGVFMYLLVKQLWGIGGGIIAAVLYLYTPYHALDIFVRGDVAEFWAYAFIPLVFYGLWMSFKEKKWRYVVVGSLGYVGVIISHNLTAMMITPFILIFVSYLYIISRKEGKKNYLPIVILVIGILLSAFYCLPVFAEMKYTNVLSQVGGGADYKDHFVCPIQLWDSPWGFGGSTATCIDGLSYKIGKLHLLLLPLSLLSLFLLRKKDKTKLEVGILFFIFTLFATFLTISQSKFIWDAIPQMAFFQYPWRFLLVISFFISFLGGSIVVALNKFIKQKYLFYGAIALVAVAIIYFNQKVFTPQTILNKTATDYTNDYQLKWVTSKISDEYMPKGFIKPKEFKEIPQEKITVNSNVKVNYLQQKTQEVLIQIQTSQSASILVNQAYFPSWQIYINGQQTQFKYIDKGLIFSVPQGEHILSLKFRQTPIEMTGNVLSLTGVLWLIIGIIRERKDHKDAKKGA
ncbi:hypothetical protein HZA75_06635 [Candidatus Roizmanbacteria bacterium]|nr:hypothetical protein [Candidatus Roizmanbacteria bacterium]